MREREQKSSGAVGCFIMGVIGFFVPVLYVLSVGPANMIATRYPSTQIFLGQVYRPLGLIAEQWEPMQRAFTWYIDLWG